MGAEAFTILAVLEARDRASAVVARLDGSMNGLASTMTRAAEATRVAGTGIDESLLQTASGADAAELASARLSAARAKQGAATDAAANAERQLLAVQQEIAAAGDADAAMTGRQVAAVDALTAAQKRGAKAAQEVAAAERSQASVAEASAARTGEAAAAADVSSTAQRRLGTEAGASTGLLSGASKAMTMVALAGGAVAAVSIKAAGDFQSATQHLVTDAGETQANLALVQKGILGVATATGTSATAVTAAMYHIESSGFHGAAGLKLLETAAEGAKVGGADFDTVAKTLTGTMNSYNMSGDQSATMMNQLIATVGAGDMKMQDLASSLGNVAPLAAAAGVSFDQVGGAIATMTAQNMSAQQASQDLANTIRAMSNPNKVAIDEMQQLGLDSNDLAQNLGKRGLTGTMDILTQAVAAHTQGGQVLIDSLKQSKNAAADANIMIAHLPTSIQAAAKGFLDGSVSSKQFTADIKALSPEQQHLAQQFEHVAKGTESFNKLLASGSPAAQTYNAAMAKLLGGATGLNTALMISGGRTATFQANVNAVADAAKKGGGQVDNWDKIQGTFNQKMDVAKASLQAAGISIGTVLLPAVSKAADAIAKVVVPMAAWIQSHQTLVGIIATLVGAITAGVIAAKLLTPVIEAVIAVTELWTVAQAGLDVAMDANPIGLITIAIEVLIAAIVAIVAGLMYAYNHFAWFHMAVNAALDGVKTAGLNLWHGLAAVWSGIVTGATWVWHMLTGAWRGIESGAVGLWHGMQAAWSGIVSAVMWVWHALEGAWSAVWGVTKTVWGAIAGFFTKWWPLLYAIFATPIFMLQSLWAHFHDDITLVAKIAWHGVAGLLSWIWGGIVAVADFTWKLIKALIVNPMLDVWHWLESTWSGISRQLGSIWDGVAQKASYVWGLIKQYIIGPITQTWHELTHLMDEISSTIGAGISAAWNYVSGIVGNFNEIGTQIIMGIVHGIEGGWDWLMHTVGDLANSALNTAKSFLGIKSPSRLFADEVGKQIPHGIAQGILTNAKVATRAVGDLALSLPGAAGSLGGAGLSVAGAGGGLGGGRSFLGASGGGGTVITFDLRGSQVMSDRDMDQFVDKIGRRLASRSLPAGGVRLGM